MAADSHPMVRRINHIGVIVDDLTEARRWLVEVFGMPLRRTVDLPEGQIHGEFFGGGDVDIEVLTIGDPAIRQKRLGNAKARIEHIAVEVKDLPAVFDRLTALGVKFTTPAPRRVGTNLNAWTVEETTGGISYQLTERISDGV